MDADEIVRALGDACEAGDRQRRGVGGEDGGGSEHGLSLLGHNAFHVAVFEHGFDDEIAARKIGIVRRRRDEGEQRVLVVLAGAALLHVLGDEVVGRRLALVRRVHVAVENGDGNAGLGGDIGDARAHEACADDADLGELAGFNVLRTARALVEFLK